MVVAAFVARPCLGVVDAELLAAQGDVGLGDMGIGCPYLDVGVCALLHGFGHGTDEGRAAVGIDGVVAAVVGYHDAPQAVALGNAAGYGEHDAVAEGYDGRLHVLVVVAAFGYGVAAFEQGRLEILVHEVEGYHDVGYGQALAVQTGAGCLLCGMVAAVVEGYGKGYLLLILIHHRHGVHASGNYYQCIFHEMIYLSC